MFRKLVSSLPFSPALVGQLGFYARRLSREQAIRRIGLIFTVLAVVVQTLILVNPPDQTYAASPTSQCSYNSALTKDDVNCRACPYNSAVWIQSSSCNANVALSVDATNLSKNQSAASVRGDPGDRIQYNLHTKNTSGAKTTATVQEPVSDLLEYATIIDSGGGVLDPNTQTVSWGTIALDRGVTDTRSFVIQLNGTFAETPQAVDNPYSYDCVLTSSYGTMLNVSLNCPLGKQVEGTIRQLPRTGAGADILFSLFVIVTVTYLYARSRQINREMRVIRRDFNVG